MARDPLAGDEVSVRHGRAPGASEEAHAAIRSAPGVVGLLALSAAVPLLSALPGVERLLGFGWRTATAAGGLFALSTLLTAWTYRAFGPGSRAYRLCNWAETLVVTGLPMGLIYASGSPANFFWVAYYAVVFETGHFGLYRAFNAAVLAGGPALLAAGFGLRGEWTAAGLCLIAGGMGAFIYWQVSRVAVRLAEAQREQERLQARLSELLVSQERARIARDLHDGLGAELSALVWRARLLASELPEGARGELEGFITRVRQSTDELRAVVWALRVEQQTWPELVAQLRTRCSELCAGSAELSFQELGAPADLTVPGELRLHLVRMAQEAVRNAVRHGRPRRVRVRLGAEGSLLLSVEDDGVGLPPGALEASAGGLKNLRHRTQASGGELRIESAPGLTRVEARWPLEALGPGRQPVGPNT